MPRGSGANMEPMPFIRSFGGSTDNGDNGSEDSFPSKSSPSEKRHRQKDKDRKSKERERSKRDRSRDRSRDRDRKSRRRRSRSRDDDRDKDRKKHRSRSPHSRKRERRDSGERRNRREASYEHEREKPSRYEESESRRSESRTSEPSRRHSPPSSKPSQGPVFAAPPPPTTHVENGGYGNGVTDIAAQEALAAAAAREARRRSRWSTNKAFVPGMPTILPSDMDDTQRQVYLLQIEVEEATRKLRMNEFTTPVEERSPSPEPVYDNMGKRLNTREVRKRQELEQRRHEKIQTLLQLMPEYKPPADYRPPNIRLHEKVWIPQDEHPEINFVGLLIGPRGNTLKSLETDTGARIIIRGKGSVKEGKLLRRDGPMPGENEPLHAFVTGTDPTVIKAAVEKIKSILDDALNRPDANNMLRQNQLRELAVLNGTLRAEDVLGGVRCSNCGSDQHKTYECTEAVNVTANIVCTACGGAGHIARDCLAPRTGYQAANNEELDNEYEALLAEIGGNPKPATTSSQTAASANAQVPFRLPPQQGHPYRPPQPLSRVQYAPPPPPNYDGFDPSAGFYPPPPPPPPSHLQPPPGWPIPENLDPVAVAAAQAAMAAAGTSFNPYALLPPPPPPPAQFGE